jgi:DNA-directed RNA polymerase subunit E'/Rpb7
MSSPYINTELYTNVPLFAAQMNNKIYLNLKDNLVNNIEKKCFRNYGYIMEVYKIIKYKDGVVEPENTNSAANFDVTFSCRLCIPLKGLQIVCQVNRVNKLLITVTNGPILVIITNERINDTTFFTDKNNNLRYRQGKQTEMLKQNEFVKVTINSVMFNNGDDKIKAIGFLDDMASEKEVEAYYKDLYDTDKKFVDIKKEMAEKENVVQLPSYDKQVKASTEKKIVSTSNLSSYEKDEEEPQSVKKNKKGSKSK